MNTEPEVPPQDRLMQSLVAFMLIQMDGELQRRLLQIEVGMMCLDGNGRYTYLDPYLGAATAIAEGCRNLAAVGASPIGATNCLNFGNPEKPEIMWQFSKVIDGIRDACQHFQVPITGGNVSFYNETEGEGIFPTPVVGLVGILEDRRLGVTHHFKGKSDLIYLLGATSEEFGGSEYLKVIHGRVDGKPPRLDLEVETAVQDLLRRAAARGLLRSAHDLAARGPADDGVVDEHDSAALDDRAHGVQGRSLSSRLSSRRSP